MAEERPITVERIRELYVKPGHPIAFSSPNAVYLFFGGEVPLHKIEKALSGVDSYSLHKELKKPRVYNPYYIYQKRQQIQGDLIDIAGLAEHNENVHFLLVLIDSFSRYLWVYPVEDKSADTMVQAFKDWLEHDVGELPKIILTDDGTEFKNKKIKALLQEYGAERHLANGKAWIAERVNKTLQVLLYKYMSENDTLDYLSVLDDFVNTYNARKHRTLEFMSPEEAELPENQETVRAILARNYSKRQARRKKRLKLHFRVGDTVRINMLKNKIMSRAYKPTQSGPYYVITRIKTKMAVPMYYVRSMSDPDQQGELKGGFYANELAYVGDVAYKIKEVLGRQGRGRLLRYLVRWKYFGPEDDSWVWAKDVQQLERRQ